MVYTTYVLRFKKIYNVLVANGVPSGKIGGGVKGYNPPPIVQYILLFVSL